MTKWIFQKISGDQQGDNVTPIFIICFEYLFLLTKHTLSAILINIERNLSTTNYIRFMSKFWADDNLHSMNESFISVQDIAGFVVLLMKCLGMY